jgi:chromatin remodeling complex protein RSC6
MAMPSAARQQVLGMSVAQLQSVLTRAYSYILAAVPQSDLSLLQLDDKLAAVLGTQQLPATELPQALSKLLQPLAPVVVQHTIE